MAHILSSASPVGSVIFAVFALLIISLVVLLILRYYLPLRTTPAFYLVPIFFALWLPSIVVILVPIDLASSATIDDDTTRGIWLPDRVVLVSWRITYWLTFALTWFILPILGEYADAGYPDPNDKLKYSLRANAQYHAIALAAGGVGLVYVSVVYGLSLESLKALVMALAYCWGLILAIYLMGHGLVSIPRRLIRNSSTSGKLRRLQTKAPKVYEHMEDSLASLEDIEEQVQELSRRKTGSAVQFRDWIEELQELANIPESQSRSTLRSTGADDPILPAILTEKYLAELTRRLLRARHSRSRYVNEWDRLVRSASDCQTILDSAASKKLDFGPASPHAPFWEKTKVMTPYTRYLLHHHVMPYTQIALGIFLAAASACIVWSEVVKLAFPKLSIIRFTVIHHWSGEKAEVGFAGQVISAFWICYMCSAALITMTEVKVWRGRALVKRNTGHESAFWYATQVAKLCIPLSYNFMTFLSFDVYSKTTFYKFLGKLIDFTALGRSFDDIFPVILLLPVLATLFGLYGRIKRIFVGMDVIEDEDDNPSAFSTGSWREGRNLIERELGGNATVRRQEAAIARLNTPSNPAAGRSAPVLSIPAARNTTASPAARSPVRPSANTRRAEQSTRTPYLDEPEDENIFQIIGHRMKNTMDTIDTPKWMQDFGQGIKKPKWMGGDDDSPTTAGSNSNSSDVRRWFGGGGSSDNDGSGQIRI